MLAGCEIRGARRDPASISADGGGEELGVLLLLLHDVADEPAEDLSEMSRPDGGQGRSWMVAGPRPSALVAPVVRFMRMRSTGAPLNEHGCRLSPLTVTRVCG